MQQLKHGEELREFWRVQKAKYRARKKAKAATISGETAQAQATPTIEGVTVHE